MTISKPQFFSNWDAPKALVRQVNLASWEKQAQMLYGDNPLSSSYHTSSSPVKIYLQGSTSLL